MGEVFKPELALFMSPDVQSSIEKGGWVEVLTENMQLNTGIFEFMIAGTDEYIDLANTYISINASVCNADGTAIVAPAAATSSSAAVAGTDVAFVNFVLHSMFQDITVYLNGEKVCGGDQVYPYKCMMSTLLAYSDAGLKQQFTAAGFIKDTAGQMDGVDEKSLGYVERKKWNSGRLYMGKLLPELFQQPRYLLNNIDVKIRFHRAPAEFALRCGTANAKPKFLINEAKLYVRKLRVSEGPIIAHERALAHGRVALYSYIQRLITPFAITAGSSRFVQENLYRGLMPKLLVVGMVSSDAFVGSYAKNPFNFQHFNANLVSLKKDGESVPFQALEPCFVATDDKKIPVNYLREYMNIVYSLNIQGRDDQLAFSYEEYPNGYCFFLFNLSPDLTNNRSTVQMEEISNIRLEVKFAKPLAEAVTLITMALFDAQLEMDNFRLPYVLEV